jgi:hypothetical protein
MYEFTDQASLDRAMTGEDLKRLVADFNRDWPTSRARARRWCWRRRSTPDPALSASRRGQRLTLASRYLNEGFRSHSGASGKTLSTISAGRGEGEWNAGTF